jgi:hypothetical protein
VDRYLALRGRRLAAGHAGLGTLELLGWRRKRRAARRGVLRTVGDMAVDPACNTTGARRRHAPGGAEFDPDPIVALEFH